jgi:hypothetical protein
LSPERSFPYLKRPFAKEVFFADTLSFVRFCGGWNPNVGVWGENTGVQGVGDLAVETDGVVSYRFGAVKERIDPFIEQGYTDLIFSIDNVPYDMAVKRDGQPVIHFYGQAAGPRSAGEWRDFMQGLGEELVRLYPDYARGWRYRVGTECNGGSRFSDTVTFWGSNLEYRAWYEATYEGLSAAFGQTPMVGPGEYSGQITIAADDKRDKDPVDYLDLAVYAQQALSPLSFVANSSHAIPRFNDSGSLVGLADPNERVDSTVSGFQTWLAAEPSLASSDKYIFQFGILQSELTHNGVNLDAGGEPGGRGAAWTMHCLFELWEQLGFKGIWHWDTTDTLTASGMSNQYLLKSNGWLYTILDHLAGGTVHSLPVARDDAGTSYKPVLVRKGDSTYLLLSAFNLSREALPARRVEVPRPDPRVVGFPHRGEQRVPDDPQRAGGWGPAHARICHQPAPAFDRDRHGRDQWTHLRPAKLRPVCADGDRLAHAQKLSAHGGKHAGCLRRNPHARLGCHAGLGGGHRPGGRRQHRADRAGGRGDLRRAGHHRARGRRVIGRRHHRQSRVLPRREQTG